MRKHDELSNVGSDPRPRTKDRRERIPRALRVEPNGSVQEGLGPWSHSPRDKTEGLYSVDSVWAALGRSGECEDVEDGFEGKPGALRSSGSRWSDLGARIRCREYSTYGGVMFKV